MRWVVALTLLVGLACQKRPSEHVKKQPEAPAAAPATDEKPVASRRARGCTTELVQAAVQPRRDEVTRCYRQAVRRNRGARGKLAVEITIDRQGEARRLSVHTDDIGDETFTRCVFSVLKQIEFPLPDKPPCIVVYPFVFSAG